MWQAMEKFWGHSHLMKDGSQISGGDSTGEFFIIGLADERGFYAVGSLHNNHYYSVQM